MNTATMAAIAVAIMNSHRAEDNSLPFETHFRSLDEHMEDCPECCGEGTNADETDDCHLCDGFGEVSFDVATQWFDENPDVADERFGEEE
jgi:hypothetical protein